MLHSMTNVIMQHSDSRSFKDKQNSFHKIVHIFLPISFNIRFWCSKEPSHRDCSFEYPQHMFWLGNRKLIFGYTLIQGAVDLILHNIGQAILTI